MKLQDWLKQVTGDDRNVIVTLYNDAHAAVMGEASNLGGELYVMDAAEASSIMPGGVTFDSAMMDFEIRRDTQGDPLPLEQQSAGWMRVSGFEPRIRSVVPVSIPNLLGHGG